jgi:hypothetical protein
MDTVAYFEIPLEKEFASTYRSKEWSLNAAVESSDGSVRPLASMLCSPIDGVRAAVVGILQ